MCIGSVVTIVMLGINSVQDLRKREILLMPTVLTFIAGLTYSALNGRTVFWILADMFPGAAVLALSLLFKGQIGMGDAIVVLSAGAWNDMFSTFFILTSALAAAAAVGGVCLMRRQNRKELPFIPFLLAGCFVELLL